jgi:hypothetical protein
VVHHCAILCFCAAKMLKSTEKTWIFAIKSILHYNYIIVKR